MIVWSKPGLVGPLYDGLTRQEPYISFLKPGGILVMDMPNIDSFNAQAAGPVLRVV